MENSLILQNKKEELGKIVKWRVPLKLAGNIFVFGRPGGGKSCKLLTIAQGLHSHGWKVWDIFGGKRDEGPFWCFPNDDYKLWNDIEKETFRVKGGPKQYKVNLLYPMFSRKLPKKLPKNSPNVKPKVFTIPFKELQDNLDDLIPLVTGPLSKTSEILWDKILESTDRNSNGQDLKTLFETDFKKKKEDKIYQLFIKPLVQNNLLSSMKGELNLDLISEAEDKETISVLCLDYVPERYRFLIMAYIMKKLFYLVKNNKIHKKNFEILRETSMFMKVVDTKKDKAEIVQIFRNIVTDIARYCRSGTYLGMDSQDSAEVKGMIEGSDDLLLLCEMPSSASREVTCTPLKKDRRMNDKQIIYIGWKIKIHEVCIVERGKRARILKRINPPRCRYWKSQYGDFVSLWKELEDKWVNTKDYIEIIEKEYNDREDVLITKKVKYVKSILPKKEKKKLEVEEKQQEDNLLKQRKQIYEDKDNKIGEIYDGSIIADFG